MFDIGCDEQLNEIVVSHRGTLGGLTQSRRSPSLVRVKLAEGKRDPRKVSKVVGVCDNLLQAARNSLILKTERCPSG
jgi:hypothetical protein